MLITPKEASSLVSLNGRFGVRNWGYIVLVIPGVWGMVYAWIADYFPPDGGDTPQTQEHIDNLGWEATPRNRVIVFAVALLMTAFGIWKMFIP